MKTRSIVGVAFLFAAIMTISLAVSSQETGSTAGSKAAAAPAPAAGATAKPAAPGAPLADAGKKLKIGFLMESYDIARWARDEQYFREKAESMGAEVIKAVADGDQDVQNQQADRMLTSGVDVLVVIPRNLKTAARIIKSAHEKNVPVVAYDRLIMNCDLDAYVTFDNEKVGYLQAKGVLEATPEGNFILLGGAASDNNAQLLRAGQLRAIKEHEAATGKKINVLDDQFLENWDKEEARRKVSNLLTKFKAQGLTINAIIASNDGTAGGAIAALKAEGLAGKVSISGQDAELAACQRIVEGTQTVTVYKPVRSLAAVSAELAVRLGRGEKAEDAIKAMGYQPHPLDNGTRPVPSIYLDPVFVNKTNMAATVIADGWHPLDKVYANVPLEQRPK